MIAAKKGMGNWRRMRFLRVVGETVGIRRAYAKGLPGREATLIEVKRTRAIVQFPDAPKKMVPSGPMGLDAKLVVEQWRIPLDWLLLPGAHEFDPRQKELPGMEGVG